MRLSCLFRSSHRRCSIKTVKKETLAQVFSSEFYEIFKSTFFPEYLRTTASVLLKDCLLHKMRMVSLNFNKKVEATSFVVSKHFGSLSDTQFASRWRCCKVYMISCCILNALCPLLLNDLSRQFNCIIATS